MKFEANQSWPHVIGGDDPPGAYIYACTFAQLGRQYKLYSFLRGLAADNNYNKCNDDDATHKIFLSFPASVAYVRGL